MKFRADRGDFNGSWLFVPVVTREDEDYTEQSREGLIVGLGWIPSQFDHVWNRGRWEQVTNHQEFVGIVTTNEELQNLNRGHNVFDEQAFDVSTIFD